MAEVEVRQRALSLSITGVPEEETWSNGSDVMIITKTQENFP